jgi:hypothetical protein
MCLALVKPSSSLARSWNLGKPSYCIYEYAKWTGEHEIRWGDGSWQRLNPEQLADLVLLPQFGEKEIDEIFNN